MQFHFSFAPLSLMQHKQAAGQVPWFTESSVLVDFGFDLSPATTAGSSCFVSLHLSFSLSTSLHSHLLIFWWYIVGKMSLCHSLSVRLPACSRHHVHIHAIHCESVRARCSCCLCVSLLELVGDCPCAHQFASQLCHSYQLSTLLHAAHHRGSVSLRSDH